MRITNNMMVQTMMRNLNRNMLRLNDKQIQFSTGKRINKPSDDPLGISKSLRLRTDISVMDQYKRNAEDAYSFMDNTETALINMLEGMQRVRELAVQASSETLTQEETIKIEAEISEIRNQLVDLANYSYSGKNVFSGKKTDQPLLDQYGNYLMDLMKSQDPNVLDDKWDFEMSTREKIQVNSLGFEIFEAEERKVVYAPTDGAADWPLELPYRDGSGSLSLTVVNGNGDGPEKLADGTWTVGANWGALPADELITAAVKEIGEITGPVLGEYRFELIQRNELDTSTDPPTVNANVEYLKAIPLNATIVDEYATPAVWEADYTADITEASFGGNTPPTIVFNGVEVVFLRDETAAAGYTIQDPPTDKNRITITLGGAAPLTDQTPANYLPEVETALRALSDIRGSGVEGFRFNRVGNTLQAIAPERSGSAHNKAYFAGTVSPTTSRENQMVVEGTSKVYYIEAGQKAGLFQMFDKLSDNLKEGKQEDISNMLNQIDAHINAMLTVRSEVGAKTNRVELIVNRIEDDTLNYKDLMSKIEDADMSQVVIELMNEENVYRSALAVGARIIQPTLLDFLR
ncbi:flagellar hook-associated protein FlgL [Anoxynatronum sibiricum]|uniref:Flagellar hook-associated protein FlgL n=1 Tax=Anoxynatronum sibiricum TaxID=210623 RepID=A0ABU9VUH7_9CLOT